MKKIVIIGVVMLAALQAAAITNESLQDMLVKFYGYQRAGLKTGSCNNLNSGFQNASHGGDNYNGNQLDGGWYDAGDYIKFGMNLSYSVYCLLKGYDVFPSTYTDKYKADHSNGADGIPDVLNQVKFATDYMGKAVINNTTVVLDVGNAESEHSTWGVVNGSGRNGTLCDGGDIPATYAACLALMSTLYRDIDSDYADLCLSKAKTAFAFAKSKFASGKYYCTPQTKQGKALYDYPTVDGDKKQQYSDRMVAAGIELYRATNNEDPQYLSWANKGMGEFANCIGYAYIGPLASFEVWRQGLGGATALTANLTFVEEKVRTSGKFNGVYQNSTWGTARDVGSAAFEYALSYVTTANETNREKYEDRVRDHVEWVSGGNGGQSYICGVNGGPTSIHYRTTNYGSVPGAVVSGPNGDGNWDNNGSAEFCEVAVDYNAGITGAVAFLNALESSDGVRLSNGFAVTPTSAVDLDANPVNITATLSKSTPWTVTIQGGAGSKTFSGTGTSIDIDWEGEADEGSFLAGEIVKARLSIEDVISILDLVKATPKSIELAKTKKPAAKAADSLVDDFEDQDSTNRYNGKWQAFGTGTGLTATSMGFATQDESKVLRMSGNVKTFENTTYAGIKTTFQPSGAPCSVGPIKSVLFDLKSTVAANVSVELEQADITDGAYYCKVVPVTTYNNSYRLDIEDFHQPDWVTSETPLNLDQITALRFTVYDSTGMIMLYLDNVTIEGLTVGTSVASARFSRSMATNMPVVANGNLFYTVPRSSVGPVKLSLFTIAGKVVMNRTLMQPAGANVSFALPKLPAGMYFASVSTTGADGSHSRRQTCFSLVR